MRTKFDPYKLLKIKRTATPEEVQDAYRALVRNLHPDKNPGDKRAEQRFKKVQAAYELLRDLERRARYDANGDTSAPRPSRGDEQVLETLNGILESVLSNVVGKGTVDLKQYDVVRKMREVLADRRRDLIDTIKRNDRFVAELALVAERFVYADNTQPSEDDNPLASMCRRKLASAAAINETAKTELVKVERAIVFVSRFAYRVDAARTPFWGIGTVTISTTAS